MTALSLCFTVIAFMLFGLATVDHHRNRFGRPLSSRTAWRMRAGAWGAVIASFPPAILAQGWVFGPVLWAGTMMLGAGIAFLTLNLLPVRETGARGRR